MDDAKSNVYKEKKRGGYSKIKSGYGRHLISPSMGRFMLLNNRERELRGMKKNKYWSEDFLKESQGDF